MKEHLWKKRVYYSDTDAQGIIYHAAYIDIAEHARTEFLTSELPSFSFKELAEKHDVIMVIKGISVDYRSPGHLGDEITVRTRVEEMKSVYCVFSQRIERDGVLLSEVRTKLAFVRPSDMRPYPAPKFLRDAFSTE